MRRTISIGVAAILAVLVGATIVTSVRDRSSSTKKVTVRGLVDAEEKAFFDSPDVQHALAARGYVLKTDAVDGPAVASAVGRAPYDFAFAPQPWAQSAATAGNVAATTSPFSTRVVFVTSRDVANTLQRRGVTNDRGGWWTIDIAKYGDLAARGEVPVVRSADPTTSTTAQLYAAAVAHASNGGKPIASPGDVDTVVNRVAPMFVRQGYVAETSAQLATQYGTESRTAPIIAIDESEYVTRRGFGAASAVVYPDPMIDVQLSVVPLTAVGQRIGHVLATDPALQRLAAAHGYRTPSKPDRFATTVHTARISVAPEDAVDLPLPSAEVLKSLIDRIDAARYSALGPRAYP